MEDDTLLNDLARRMIATESFTYGDERDEVRRWLEREENNVLLQAMQRVQRQDQSSAAQATGGYWF